MRAAVILFPGLNAETEMARALRLVCAAEVTTVWHTDAALPKDVDLVAIPGGFSYGDYLRCGAIAKVSPIGSAIRAHAEAGGFVLGVCNGFQILTEMGLLPGALTRNLQLRFECRDITVRVDAEGPFSPTPGTRLTLPIAHAEGRYTASDELVAALEKEGRIALRYADDTGASTNRANPNGSVSNIAGIYGGPKKNILGLMPHPERAVEPNMGSTSGAHIFKAIRDHVQHGNA